MYDEKFIEEIKEAFFDGMARGWAGGAKPIKSVEFPGYDVIKTESGKFVITDVFYFNKTGNGFGFTTIGHKKINLAEPIWVMNYWGMYPASVVGFLKEVLLCAYEDKKFLGGRGYLTHEKNDLIYKNDPVAALFRNFSGTEKITDVTKLQLGWHQYHGRLLLA